jgi:Protein of unknown function (DUF3261)
MKTVAGAALALALLAWGCAHRSTRALAPLPEASLEPRRVVEAFAARLPDPLQVVNTATFEIGWQTLVVLGLTSVDAARGTFAVVGLYPAGGVKLFEVEGDRASVRRSFAQPQLLERGDLTAAVAEDTRRIYLDRVPSGVAIPAFEDGVLRFRQPAGAGELAYVFAGPEAVLAEKSYREDEHEVWTVSYRDYREEEGDLYPSTIVLEHHDHDYRLTLHLKEILS